MVVVDSVSQLQSLINDVRRKHQKVGFVPTMGALHQGHLALVKQCVEENDFTVVSIFVNPSQFNNPDDLRNYPRVLETDMELMSPLNVDVVFNPSVVEMYPEPDNREFDFGSLGVVMEGEHRKGHFNGVAQIVSKLFNAVNPHRAYFGEKDFQQLAIIQEMVRMLKYDIQIVACPIVREKDGLAMSSRNQRLKSHARKSAPLIWKTLSLSRERANNRSVEEVKQEVIRLVNEDPQLEVEYFEISDVKTLQAVSDWSEAGEKIGCIAVFAGEIRLIDNIIYS